jgi:hypothetical protein
LYITFATHISLCLLLLKMTNEVSCYRVVIKYKPLVRRQNDWEICYWILSYGQQLMSSIFSHYGSQATMSKTFSKIYNEKSRHISLRHEYIRQLISDG